MLAGSHRGQCPPNGDAGRFVCEQPNGGLNTYPLSQERPSPIMNTSAKTNLGHLEASAGMAGAAKFVTALLAGCCNDCSTTKAFSNVSTFWRAVLAHPTTTSESRLQPGETCSFNWKVSFQFTVSIRSWGLLNPHMDTNGYPVPGSNDEPTQISDNTCCASIFLRFKGLLRKWALWLRCQVRQDSIWIRKHSDTTRRSPPCSPGISGVSSFGFGGTNARGDLWGRCSRLRWVSNAGHRMCRKCGCQGSSSYRATWYWCLGATTSGHWVWRHISHPLCNPLLAKLCQEWMSHKMSLGSRRGYCESFSFASCGPVCKACTGRLWLLLPQQSHYGRVGVRLGLCPADAKIPCTLPVTGRWPKLSCGQQPCQPQQASACSMEDPLEQRWYAMGSWSLVHTIWFWKGKIHAAMPRWMLSSKLARQLAHMIFLTVSFTQLASLAQCAGEQCSGPGLVVHS